MTLEDPTECSISAVLLATVTRGLESSDRFVLLRSMETLGRLAQRDVNEPLILASLDSHVMNNNPTAFPQFCQFPHTTDRPLFMRTPFSI